MLLLALLLPLLLSVRLLRWVVVAARPPFFYRVVCVLLFGVALCLRALFLLLGVGLCVCAVALLCVALFCVALCVFVSFIVCSFAFVLFCFVVLCAGGGQVCRQELGSQSM